MAKLSPILFNLFVNDLPASIAATNEGVQFGDSTIFSLLYADDLVMIADSEQALQTLYLGKSMNGVPYGASKLIARSRL